jgi:hypothetical protein
MKELKKLEWQRYNINFSEEVNFSYKLLEYSINKFKSEIVNNLEDNQFYHLQLQCNFHVIDDDTHEDYYMYRSLSYFQFFKKNGSKESTMIDIFWQFWTDDYSENYKLYLIESLSFVYKLVPSNINYLLSEEDVKQNVRPKELTERVNYHINTILKINEHLTPEEELKKLNYQKQYNNLIPLTMDITRWGYTIFNDDFTLAKCWVYSKDNYTISNIILEPKLPVLYDSESIKLPEYFISIYKYSYNVSVSVKGNEIFKFEDKIINTESNKGLSRLDNFIRNIKNTTYLIQEGEETFTYKDKKVQFIPTKSKDNNKGTNFITMDLETKEIDGKLVPYCVSIFNGKIASSFYITDFKDSTEMLENAVKSLMKKEYNGYKVYLHNFSFFDGIFLLKIITSLSDKVKILMREEKLIDVKLYYGTKYKISFRDSLLLLPSKLWRLAKDFGVEEKGLFPYKFVNKPEVDFKYIGSPPKYEDFEQERICDCKYQEYVKEFNNNNWNLETETIKSCSQYLILLYQIIENLVNLF